MLSRFRQVYQRTRNHFYYKKAFPKTFISPLVSLTGDCTIGTESQLRGRSTIQNSTIGSHSVVESGLSIIDSCLGRNVRLTGGSSLTRVHIGNNVKISHGCSIFEAQIGSYTYIAQENLIGYVSLGSFCSVGPRVIFGYGEHPTHLVSTSPVFYSTAEQCGISFTEQDYLEEQSSISVGHDVWIGACAYVRNGIVIGNGAIVGAGAVVTKDVPPYAIVGGVPARIIRYRFEDQTIAALLNLEWWKWDEEKLRQVQPLFARGDVAGLLELSLV